LKPSDRIALSKDIIDFIINRTRSKGLDKNNTPFKKYSKEYIKSLDFKNAGKSAGKVNITLSGDTLESILLLSHKTGEITLGFEKGSEANKIAEGNITGSYGQSKPSKKRARDVLGISPQDLTTIQDGNN